MKLNMHQWIPQLTFIDCSGRNYPRRTQNKVRHIFKKGRSSQTRSCASKIPNVSQAANSVCSVSDPCQPCLLGYYLQSPQQPNKGGTVKKSDAACLTRNTFQMKTKKCLEREKTRLHSALQCSTEPGCRFVSLFSRSAERLHVCSYVSLPSFC